MKVLALINNNEYNKLYCKMPIKLLKYKLLLLFVLVYRLIRFCALIHFVDELPTRVFAGPNLM